MQNLIFIFKLIKYKIFAKHKKAYGIHSPFLYNFITEIIFNKQEFEETKIIAEIRKELRKDTGEIIVKDFGAGSKKMKSANRKISEIAKYSAVRKKYGELLFRIVEKYKPKTIIELGTSLGISTLYLSLPDKKSTVHTIEYCPETAGVALSNFRKANVENIKQSIGNIDVVLPELLNEIEICDFVFFDGNHKKMPTVSYFNLCMKKAGEKSIFVFDDIHWSKEMEEAWCEIKKSEKVTLTIDLFFFGIVFFNKDLSKENFIVNY